MTMGPTQVMRMEHQQMRDLMSQAQAAIDAGDTDEYMGQAETLLIMMQQHNMKEENMLYPMCDQHLSAELPAILERLRNGTLRGMSHPKTPHVVDARYMEPPGLRRDDGNARHPQDGEKMLLLLFREPHPLYKVLRQNGHDYETELLPDGTFEILITR